MSDNDVEDLTKLPKSRFRRRVRIDLYDQDAGWCDDDDHLGRMYVRATQAGRGEQQHHFTGD